MKTTHTPAPQCTCVYQLYSEDHKVYPIKKFCPLHAAAPVLLAELQSFVSRWSFPKKPTGRDLDIYLESARDAIAKAVQP